MKNKLLYRYLGSSLVLLAMVSGWFPLLPVLAAGNAVAGVSAPAQPVSNGAQFVVSIDVQPNNEIAGAQFNLSFNPSLVSVSNITEGNLFKQNGAGTYFLPGQINNTNGTISGAAGVIITPGQTVSSSGTLATITMTAGAASGISALTLLNVIVGDINGQPIGVNASSAQVVIGNSTNHAPVMSPLGSKAVNEGVLLTFTVTATDADDDALTYSASNLPSGASFNTSTHVFSWTPGFSQAGSYPNVHFAVSDGSLSAFENITISVNNVNQPPVLNLIGNKQATTGQLLGFTVSASDIDNDTLTYSVSNLPSGSEFNDVTRSFSWTPSTGQVGTYSNIGFQVSDGLSTISENITITVATPSPPSTGGGGGGGGTPALPPGSTDLSQAIGSDGILITTSTVLSADGNCALSLDKGTKSLTIDGEPLKIVSMVTMKSPPIPPEPSNIIGLAYNFGPERASFNPPVTLTLSYPPSLVPAGVDESSLVIATWDENSGKWIELESVVDPDTNTITAIISHFSVYAILHNVHPASFSINNIEVEPSEVNVGQSVKISASITNTGDLPGNYTVSLSDDNTVKETKEIVLPARTSQIVDFNLTTDRPGKHVLGINELSAELTVKEAEAIFNTGDITISPAEIYAGDMVSIRLPVINSGNIAGSYELQMKINGQLEDTRSVNVAAGATEEVVFNVRKQNTGSYDVDINGLKALFENKELTAIPASTPVFSWAVLGVIIGIALFLIAVTAVVILLIRRRLSQP